MRQPRLEDTTVQVRGGAQGASQSLNVTHWFVAGPYQPLATQPGRRFVSKEKDMLDLFPGLIDVLWFCQVMIGAAGALIGWALVKPDVTEWQKNRRRK